MVDKIFPPHHPGSHIAFPGIGKVMKNVDGYRGVPLNDSASGS